jgi:hypothetical protein
MAVYKLYGQIWKPCSPNGHLTIRFTKPEDDPCGSFGKLESIHTRFTEQEVLMKPTFDEDDKTDFQKPFSQVEFVVKVPKDKRINLPKVNSYVVVYVKPGLYKFEKKGHVYTGWNIRLRKISLEEYKYVG